ncbi:DUF423 domain-containing protein [Seonamhaeicola aphaedonensis]|uniref:Uncharacterized membrane protein YgdD (TMEM256/DUF423 family) n=1 Tax=Seonamhaeicola aphaedonensis TaxID=1461338 RepID=A0A3D9HH60_9FLAO|nr:DUF423 domain-containing protein [Seonamhaeicola aphaedonensis]RED48715.1 uncharacterized membrane protein YgdD (TMEM256/DUF423 family) [Seonamhaeicola aphaedonensis]
MKKPILLTAAILGLLAIILGAFGAHTLKELISMESQKTFETGVRYQMYHALLLLYIGGSSLIRLKVKKVIFYLVVFGVVFFSGSIYGLATNALWSFNFKAIGFITPIGGLLFVLAWSFLFIEFSRINKKIK